MLCFGAQCNCYQMTQRQDRSQPRHWESTRVIMCADKKINISSFGMAIE